MESPNGQLFIAIQERLKAKATSLKWIDQNLGQLDITPRPPVNFPCALIDLVGFVYEDLPNGAQRATGKAVITIATSPFNNSNAVTPMPQREKALDYYEIEKDVHKALHNWSPANGFDKLTRRTMDKQEREDSIRERFLVFDCGYLDCSAVKATTSVARPNPVIGGDVLLPT